MILRRLRLEQFRNYELAEINWDSQLNLIYGANAQGKSNLLEAICYLGTGASFRGAADSDMIRYDQPYFYLEAEAESKEEGKLRLTAAQNRSRQRKWTVNNQPKQRLSDVVGTLHTVIFAPEDIYLVKAGPGDRRRYLNRQMSQLDREYCRLLIRYNHVLKQRNACLRQLSLNGAKEGGEELGIWSRQLCELGSKIILRREKVTFALQALSLSLHSKLAEGERLEISYHCPVLTQAKGEADAAAGFTEKKAEEAEAALTAAFLRELKRLERPELMRGMTLAGPHRDDLLIRINGRPAKEYASQGQQRTAALSMKLAELELAGKVREEYPLLLLDDVLSELDDSRRREILRFADGRAQTFISAVEGRIPPIRGRRFLIKNGKVLKID